MTTIHQLLEPYEPLFSDWGYRKLDSGKASPRFLSPNGSIIEYDSDGEQLKLVFIVGQSQQFRLLGPCWPANGEDELKLAVAAFWEFLVESGFRKLREELDLPDDMLAEQAVLYQVVDRYDARFKSRGFVKRLLGWRGPRFVSMDGKSVEYDHGGGGFMTLFLEVGEPTYLNLQSKMWAAECGETLEKAMAQSFEYLEQSGFRLLEEALRLPEEVWRDPDDSIDCWRTPCKIVVTWPVAWSVNDLVMAAKRSLPAYSQIPSLELLQMLDRKQSILIHNLSILEALELVQLLHPHGFTTEVSQGCGRDVIPEFGQLMIRSGGAGIDSVIE